MRRKRSKLQARRSLRSQKTHPRAAIYYEATYTCEITIEVGGAVTGRLTIAIQFGSGRREPQQLEFFRFARLDKIESQILTVVKM